MKTLNVSTESKGINSIESLVLKRNNFNMIREKMKDFALMLISDLNITDPDNLFKIDATIKKKYEYLNNDLFDYFKSLKLETNDFLTSPSLFSARFSIQRYSRHNYLAVKLRYNYHTKERNYTGAIYEDIEFNLITFTKETKETTFAEVQKVEKIDPVKERKKIEVVEQKIKELDNLLDQIEIRY